MDETTKLSMILQKTKTSLEMFVKVAKARVAAGIDLRKQGTQPDETPQIE
jgi:hypothetical protein